MYIAYILHKQGHKDKNIWKSADLENWVENSSGSL